MRGRLKRKGFEAYEIEDAMVFLEKAGFLQDETVAREVFRHALEGKHLGRRGIEMFLYKRGIERELASDTLSSLTREMEEKAAAKLVEKKLRTLNNKPVKVVKQRLWGMLQRRGFSGDIINSALRSIEGSK
jgi:regulatory protein